LRVPARNQRIGGRRREHREVPGVVPWSETLRDGQRAPCAIPLQDWVIAPEQGDVGLFCGSTAPNGGPERFGLLIVARPFLTAEVGRRLGPVLRRCMQGKWVNEDGLWGLRREKREWCRNPNARTRARHIVHRCI